MIAPRAGAGVIALGCVFACGAFGEGRAPTDLSVADAGSGDGSSGADGDATDATDAPPTDGATEPDFCSTQTNPLFCADFETGNLPQNFDRADKYGADTITLTLTPPPDRKLAVNLPAGSSGNAHRLEKPLTMPGIFEVSFELSGLNGLADQYIEIIDIASNSDENLAITARLNVGTVEALLAVPAVDFDRKISLGTLPTVPTRYTMKVTATHFVAQRGSEMPTEVALEAAVGGLKGACTLRVGVYYANAPDGGSFQLDDVVVAN